MLLRNIKKQFKLPVSGILIIIYLSGCASMPKNPPINPAYEYSTEKVNLTRAMSDSIDKLRGSPDDNSPLIFVKFPIVMMGYCLGIPIGILELFGLKFKVTIPVKQLKPNKQAEIEAIAQTVLPTNSRLIIKLVDGMSDHPVLMISGHLLEGESPHDYNPLVRGNYGNQKALVEFAEDRASRILQILLLEGILGEIWSDFKTIEVSTWHGVRWINVISRQNKATMIYAIAVDVDTIKVFNHKEMKKEDIIHLWRVVTNKIPELEFKPNWTAY
jgi:hypothetical protein